MTNVGPFGVTEGELMAIFVLLTTGVYGQTIWDKKLFDLPFQLPHSPFKNVFDLDSLTSITMRDTVFWLVVFCGFYHTIYLLISTFKKTN